jgi:conjugative transfer signal peptidase TraF
MLLGNSSRDSRRASNAARCRRRLVAALVATWLAVLVAVFTAGELGLRFNTSPSVPLGFYHLSARAPLRGDYVAACPPPSSVFKLARAHGYLGRGPCPGDFVPIIKLLAAVEGDDVRIDRDGVRVNTVLWRSSAPKPSDRSGWALPQLAGFRAVLRRSDVLLMSKDCDVGFDGRYFGTLPSSVISAAAVPLLTW